jgi:F0F1-type ATP synthase epsilon subunit
MCDEKTVFEGTVSEVKTTTSEGPTTILARHQPYMAKITGQVSYITSDGQQQMFAVDEGFIYTNGSICHIVVGTATVGT